MIACPRPARSSCEGLTALETAVVLFITAIVAVPLLATAGWVVDLPVEWRANVEAARDAREVLRQVADDARQASCFQEVVSHPSGDGTDASGTSWEFTWVDYTSHRFFEVHYSHLEDDIVREETISRIGEDAIAQPCSPPKDLHQLSREAKIIGSVVYFDILRHNRNASRCIILAKVSLSQPGDASIQYRETPAMMRPDNAECR